MTTNRECAKRSETRPPASARPEPTSASVPVTPAPEPPVARTSPELAPDVRADRVCTCGGMLYLRTVEILSLLAEYESLKTADSSTHIVRLRKRAKVRPGPPTLLEAAAFIAPRNRASAAMIAVVLATDAKLYPRENDPTASRRTIDNAVLLAQPAPACRKPKRIDAEAALKILDFSDNYVFRHYPTLYQDFEAARGIDPRWLQMLEVAATVSRATEYPPWWVAAVIDDNMAHWKYLEETASQRSSLSRTTPETLHLGGIGHQQRQGDGTGSSILNEEEP